MGTFLGRIFFYNFDNDASRGDTILEEISENLTLTNIGFESQQNLSCLAVNEIGAGESDSLQISVFGKMGMSNEFLPKCEICSAPPSFTKALPDTLSVLSDEPDFVLTCEVSSQFWVFLASSYCYVFSIVFRLNVTQHVT